MQYVPLPDGMAYDGGLYKQMPGLVRDIKLNVSVVRSPITGAAKPTSSCKAGSLLACPAEGLPTSRLATTRVDALSRQGGGGTSAVDAPDLKGQAGSRTSCDLTLTGGSDPLVSPQVVLPPSQSVSTSGTAPGEPVSPWENMVRVGLLRMLADEARRRVENSHHNVHSSCAMCCVVLPRSQVLRVPRCGLRALNSQ